MFFSFNKHRKKAEELVGVSRLLAVSSLTSFLDKFPALNRLIKNPQNTNDWDFFMTVAGVHAAIHTMDSTTQSRSAEKLGSHVRDNLGKWNKSGLSAFSDLLQFVQRNNQGGVDYHIALGLWVVWNLKGSEPTRTEIDVAPAIGNYLIAAFADWWKKAGSI